MPITPEQKARAESTQRTAARDPSVQVRLLAGPGTGKSFAIEERVRWLLQDEGHAAERIAVVSFTRASAAELRERILDYCQKHGVPNGPRVQVSTLHSLALKSLRKGGFLSQYPVEPLVLDDWELENILDPEFGHASSISSKPRREAVRRQHEAFWSTGTWNPANYIAPTPPISQAELLQFSGFLSSRSQVYSCVLPGEIIRQCVDKASAGVCDLVSLLDLRYLIVDEYQDLNPCDLEFVDILVRGGVRVFVAGDDDQSIYSFRYAAPVGLQEFLSRYATAVDHSLNECFRCTPEILQAAYTLVEGFPDPKRLPKHITSLYAGAAPPLQGRMHRWELPGARVEARAVAESCRDLINAGIHPSQIMVLLSNSRALAAPIAEELTRLSVPFEEPRPEPFSETPEGRLGMAILRSIMDLDDYVALRTLLGARPGTGVATCASIAEAITSNNLNLRQVLTMGVPDGVFQGRPLKAITETRRLLALINGLTPDDLLGASRAKLVQAFSAYLGGDSASVWSSETDKLPDGMRLGELLVYISLPPSPQRDLMLAKVHARLQIEAPEASGAGIRIMTMHGAKGLSSQIVFIPGLEEAMLPGQNRAPYAGLVNEGARLLFVSITRARLACIVSFARRRTVNGTTRGQTPSRYCTALGGAFVRRTAGLSPSEVQEIAADTANL